jgi:dienelactone hydrolase
VKSYLRIDEKKIYITGLSMGGYGAWTMIEDYPKLFAAAAPVCGAYNHPSKASGIAKENLPVWAFHGVKDNVVKYTVTTNMVNAINATSPKPTVLALISITMHGSTLTGQITRSTIRISTTGLSYIPIRIMRGIEFQQPALIRIRQSIYHRPGQL